MNAKLNKYSRTEIFIQLYVYYGYQLTSKNNGKCIGTPVIGENTNF